MTVLDNIALPLKYAHNKFSDVNNKVNELTGKLELSDKLNFFPSQPSVGQCQSAAIACAFGYNLRILFDDKSIGDFDAQIGNHIYKISKNLNACSMTVVIVTHDMEIASMCNRKIEIKDDYIYNDYVL